MIELACQHCGYKWGYQGQNKYYATCPQCRYKVKIPEDIVSILSRRKLDLELKKRVSIERNAVKLRGVAAIVNKAVEEYGHDKSMLIQILLRLQRSFGWLPREMLSEVSKQLNVPVSQVYQIATFYKAFSLAPRGKHLVRVCMGTSCKVRGSQTILEQAEKSLNVERDGTTADGKFSLETVNCVGCCALGPVMTINEEYHGNLKSPDVEKVLSKYRQA
jgi:NADH-quinone oxidoreductase subunit E